MALSNQLNKAWQWLDNLIPTLDEDGQRAIYDDMRKNAIVDIDFVLLILLASGIAYFGLQQDSAVVIIGAMLVAPLMSPMMSIGFSIVNGNLPLFFKSAVSTLIGIALAVGVSALITFIFPLKTATEQILARTNPTIMDLFVALISGMAGAYALSRKEVSTALPGVAIAASLIPPLCVAGFGIGAGDFGIATKSLVLFMTNLACIIVAGIFIFWLVGFRPDPATDEKVFRATVRYALLGVLLISIPLVIYTVQGAQETAREAEVAKILGAVNPAIAEIEDIVIRSVDDGFVIGMTVYLYATRGETEAQQDAAIGAAVEKIRSDLETAVGRPVTMQARVIPSNSETLERPGLEVEELDP